MHGTRQCDEVIPLMEKTTAFGKGSFSKGDPGGGFPMALTICTSPGCITGDLRVSTQTREKLDKGDLYLVIIISPSRYCNSFV